MANLLSELQALGDEQAADAFYVRGNEIRCPECFLIHLPGHCDR